MKNTHLNTTLKSLFVFISTALISCSHSGISEQTTEKKSTSWGSSVAFSEKKPQELSVMAYNLENFFDTEHDEDTEDWPYLPLSQKKNPQHEKRCEASGDGKDCLEMDWNQEVVSAKIKNLASVILSVDQGQGPDILLVEEVENLKILNQLNQQGLQGKYQTVVLEKGFDTRGINVGLMSRLPLAGKPQLHRIPFKPENAEEDRWQKKSRGIYEVPLRLPQGDTLFIFVVHFPSQRNPPHWRQQASEFLADLILKKGPQAYAIAGGDFNITHDENEKNKFFSQTLSTAGSVTHLVGCQSCDGSHYYRGEWSFLDALIFSKAFSRTQKTWSLEVDKIDTPRAGAMQVKKDGTPLRFFWKKKTGVSDHLPIYARIRWIEN